MIRRSRVQKKCQKGVNTRENPLRRHAVSVYQEARTQQQPIVLSRSFPCCSFLLPEISQTCSQLIHTRFLVVLASGLRLEISCESDKKKMNLIFNYDKKFFLTGKMKRVCRRQTEKPFVGKNFVSQSRRIWTRRNEQNSLLVGWASRVDRIRLCAQFLLSASGA